MGTALTVGVVGDFDDASTPHRATNEAVGHAAAQLGVDAEVRWLPTGSLEASLDDVQAADAVWCAPGSPYRSMSGALRALQYSREHHVPTLGTCGGCQHIIIEYARNVLGYKDAQHAEYDPYASQLFVSELVCSLAGQTMEVSLAPGSTAASLYGRSQVLEEYYCNFGLNPKYQQTLHEGGLRVAGWDDQGEARLLELPGHPFYVATLFVPQTRSTPERPHPLIVGLLQAALDLTHEASAVRA